MPYTILVSFAVYPEPIMYPANKVYPKEAKCKIIRGSKIGILTLSFIKKTIFCRFLLPFCYPIKNIFLPLQPKETKSKRQWHSKRIIEATTPI